MENVNAVNNARSAWDVLYDQFVKDLNSKYGLNIKLGNRDYRDYNCDVYCAVIGDIIRMGCKKPSVTFDGIGIGENGKEILEGVKFAWNEWDTIKMRNGEDSDNSVYCLRELADRIDDKTGLFTFRKWNWEVEKVEYKVVGFGEEGSSYEDYEKKDRLRLREWIEWKYIGDRVGEKDGMWRKVEIVWMERDGVWRKV